MSETDMIAGEFRDINVMIAIEDSVKKGYLQDIDILH